MNKLNKVLYFICEHYPNQDELSNTRLTKLVYLIDWANSLKHHAQITNIKWIFNHYGPYVDDIINTAESDDNFTIVTTQNYYGTFKQIIKLIKKPVYEALSNDDIVTINKVISETSNLYWDDFINLVYSTYPIKSQSRYSELNLVGLAKEYNDLRKIPV